MLVSDIPELWCIEYVVPLSLRKGRESTHSQSEHPMEDYVRIGAIGQSPHISITSPVNGLKE